MSTPPALPPPTPIQTKAEELLGADVDLVDTDFRFAGYTGRIATVLRGLATSPATRYLAYTSDVGEGFRPVVPPWFVRLCYGISWGYVLADTANETKKVFNETQDSNEAARVGSRRLVFNALASMLGPMVTIHTIVHQSGHGLKKLQGLNPAIAKWGPVALGLAIVPALPFMFDEPVEQLVDSVWDAAWPSKFPQKEKHHGHGH